jgi:MFS family permease
LSSRVISQKTAVSVVYAGAMFIAVMDQTIVNVALTTIAHQFHAPAAGVAGIVIGYQVAVGLSIPAAAWLGDRLGPRQVLLGAIAVFTVASALSSPRPWPLRSVRLSAACSSPTRPGAGCST